MISFIEENYESLKRLCKHLLAISQVHQHV